MGCPQRAHTSRFALRYEISFRFHSPTSVSVQPVDRARGLLADETLLDVTLGERTVAARRRAVAAAAGHTDLHLVAHSERNAGELRRRDRPELFDEGSPVLVPGSADPEPADGADAAAQHAPGLRLHPVEKRAHRHLGDGDGEDALAAETAAELPRPARIGYERV